MDNRHGDFFRKIHNLPYFGTNPIVLYNAAKNSQYLLQRLRCRNYLKSHSGCVNTISWNSTGRYILSGSDDLHLAITDAFTGKIKTKIRTGHTTNIFSAKYLPNTDDTKVVSCSGDGMVIYTDLNCPETAYKNIFDCQSESLYDIVTVPNDPNTFLTCSQNKTVRWYDLRCKQSCQNHRIVGNRYQCVDDILVTCDHPVTAIAVNQLIPWQLAVGCSDAIIRIYDRRMLSTTTLGRTLSKAQQNASIVAKFTYDGMKDPNRITSLAYSRNCQQLLASFSNENVYLFNLYDVKKTVSFGKEDDVIAEKPQHVTPPFKRFRLRGDWTGTGPNSLTNEEQRLADQNNANNENNISSNISVDSQQSNTSSSSSTNSDQSSSSNRSTGRLRQLNGILNMLFRSALPDSDENLHENNEDNQSTTTSTSMQNNHDNSSTSTASSATSTANNTAQPTSSTNNEPNLELFNNSPPPAAITIGDNNSESSSDSLGFFMIFDDDSDYNSTRLNRNNEDDNESSDFNIGDIMIEDDSDQDSDSVFDSDHPSTPNHGNNLNAEDQEQGQRSRSSSSSESYRNIYLHRLRNQHKQLISMSSDMLSKKQKQRQEKREKRAKIYKIKNFKKFTGHRNSRTVIKEATFWGDNYIISGSDCGHIFFWSIETGEVVMILQGDQHVVNCLQPHPTEPILASSGIDYDIKIWGPDSEESLFSLDYAKKLMNRNKSLLEQSRDTVTVPARFVLRLFSSMQQRQQRGRNTHQQNNNDGTRGRDEDYFNRSNPGDMDD